MQIKGKYSWLKHLDFMIVDLVALILAFVLAFRIKFHDGFTGDDNWVRLLVLVCLISIIISLIGNPYSGIFRRSYYQEVIRALQLAFFNFITTSVIFYLLKIGDRFSRQMLIYMYIFYFVFSLVLKYVWKKLIVSKKIVIYSTKQISLFIISNKSHAEKDIYNASAGAFKLYEIKGIFLVDGSAEATIGDVPIVKENYIDYILSHNINEVLIAVPPSDLEQRGYEVLSANGVTLNFSIEAAVGFETEDQLIANIGVYKTLSIGTFYFTPKQMLYLIVKRLLDIVFGLIGTVILVPVTLGVKLAYLASGDKAKVFYRQKRIGQNGKIIYILKFRSMVTNADEVLQEMLKDEKYRLEWEENQKFSNDPRITKIGRILRKTSIDEFPQFINVLKGEMSFVGPRPLIEGELEAHGGLMLYHKVKPGITGWWGCNGRSNIDYRERLELEYYYIRNCSFYLDLLCIVRTAMAVIKRDGAQ